jgi:hypothetical protein
MTLVADIPARGAPAHGAERLGRDQRMAVGKAWLCMLGGLAEIGVRFATFLTHGIAPARGEPRRPMMAFLFAGDPVIAFERVARAVRLAVALACRIEAELRALRSGQSLGPDALLSRAPAPRTTAMNAVPEAEEETAPPRDKGREIGLEAPGETAPTPERPESLGGELNEDLREDAEFYRLLNGPLKNAVAAICADLGLAPDWSLWTETGFPPPPGGGEDDWIAFFVPEGEVGPIPRPDGPGAKPPPPPRYDGEGGKAEAGRPRWPPPDRAARPDDPGSRTRRASLLGSTSIAGAPGAAARLIACSASATSRPVFVQSHF